jgi:diguanylate cyclase (GGDEF)-like protein
MGLVLGAGCVLLGAFVLRALTGLGGGPAQQLFATWISDAIVLSAVSVCLWRAHVERRDRSLWLLAGLGMAAWGLGNAYFEHTLASGASLPNPSPADIGYLGFYPLVYLAVIAARRRHVERLGAGLWLDGAIGAAACVTLGAALVLEPVLSATTGESVAGALTNIAYPIGDLTLLAMLVVTSATVGWRHARGLTPLAAGMALFALSDTLYIVENATDSYQAGGVLDAGWLLALMLMAAGAALRSRTGEHPAGRALSSRRAIVPSVAGTVALVVLGLHPFAALSTTSLACAILTLALVVVRLAISLQETARLLLAREHEATHDPLTGLANRRVLIADLSRRAAEATAAQPALLVLFDLDGFKLYNDTFGHSAGDDLLIAVARSLGDALGERGRAYRIGGDEFCALLTLELESPEAVGEQLAAAMARRGEGFAIAASYGCAALPADGREATALLRRADDGMYVRKGRHRRGPESQAQRALAAALSTRDPGNESTEAAALALRAADLLVSREQAARRRLEAQLSYQSDHDPLTGLLNRRRFAAELERMLRYASRYGRAGALLMLDLDNLKLVNDVHGHTAGDEAVKAVAREILGRTRSTDYVARLGGDEFAIALHEADEPQALTVAEEIRARLGECEIDPPVQISIGIARFAGDQELVADDLLTAADMALYDAKESGRGQIRVYRGDAGAALGWIQRIRDALAEERFVLYGQPIVDLRAGHATHRELLVRMLSDDGDAIPPDAFLPTAERFGLINDIDRWVTSRGLALACAGDGVSINLSAHSIGDPRILDLVRAAVREGLERGKAIFEITETAAMRNMQDARVFTEALGELGCDVALDDFGTGFGSFSYLKHLPSRYLKIDLEFVRELTSNVTDQQVVRSITDVGHSLDKRIIAEGVEDRTTLHALRAYGVDCAQGFYLGAPQRISPPTRLEQSLRGRPPAPDAERAQ